MTQNFFIMPDGSRQQTIQIGPAEGKATHTVSAQGILDVFMLRDAQSDAIVILGKSLEREREKIRRLMRALGEEIIRE